VEEMAESKIQRGFLFRESREDLVEREEQTEGEGCERSSAEGMDSCEISWVALGLKGNLLVTVLTGKRLIAWWLLGIDEAEGMLQEKR